MESLRSQLPDLALTISSPDLNSITQFFLSKSLTEASTDGNKEKDSTTSMRVDVVAKDQERTRAPMLFDRYRRIRFFVKSRDFSISLSDTTGHTVGVISGVVLNRRRTRRTSRRSVKVPRTLSRSRTMARNECVRNNWRLVPREACPPLPRPQLTYPRLIRKSRT